MIFPNRCLGCDAWLEKENRLQICSPCEAGLHFLEAPGFFPNLKTRYFNEAFSCLAYEGKILEWIHQYKYSRRLYFIKLFGRFLEEKKLAWEEYDFLIPVPLHWWRQMMRGFNPSHFLSFELSQKKEKQILPCLKKTKWTKSQMKLNRASRLENVQGAFRLLPRFQKKIEGKHLLLVDDVLTTGATLNECAKVLKKSGAAQIDLLTLARTL